MIKLWLILSIVGALAGLGIIAFAHSSNGFQTGPLVFLALVLCGIGALLAVILFVFGKRGPIVVGIGAFSTAMLVVLVVIPIIWSYPASEGPRPIPQSEAAK